MDQTASRTISSCFDCVLLEYYPANKEIYFCGAYKKPLKYEQARRRRYCSRKQYDRELVAAENYSSGIHALYLQCVEYIFKYNRPFTSREFFSFVDNENKNSLWNQLEKLVQYGLLYKRETIFTNWQGRSYHAKVYYPKFTSKWPKET